MTTAADPGTMSVFDAITGLRATRVYEDRPVPPAVLDRRVPGDGTAHAVDELVGALGPLGVDAGEGGGEDGAEATLPVAIGHDEELPRLGVPRAARVGRGLEDPGEHGRRHRPVRVDARGAQPGDRGEERRLYGLDRR